MWIPAGPLPFESIKGFCTSLQPAGGIVHIFLCCLSSSIRILSDLRYRHTHISPKYANMIRCGTVARNHPLCTSTASTVQHQLRSLTQMDWAKEKGFYLIYLHFLHNQFAHRFPMYSQRPIYSQCCGAEYRIKLKRWLGLCSVIRYFYNNTIRTSNLSRLKTRLPGNDKYLEVIAKMWYQKSTSVDEDWIYMWEAVSKHSLESSYEKIGEQLAAESKQRRYLLERQQKEDLARGGLRKALLRRDHHRRGVQERKYRGHLFEIPQISRKHSLAPTPSFRRIPYGWDWHPSKMNAFRRDIHGRPVVREDSNWRDENGRLIEGRGSINRILNVSEERLPSTHSV